MADLQSMTIDDTGYLGLPSGTTAQRPTSPATGYTRWNTTYDCQEIYDGTNWSLVDKPLVKYLGTLSTTTNSSNYTLNVPVSYGGLMVVCLATEASSGTAITSSASVYGNSMTQVVDLFTDINGGNVYAAIFVYDASSNSSITTSIEWALSRLVLRAYCSVYRISKISSTTAKTSASNDSSTAAGGISQSLGNSIKGSALIAISAYSSPTPDPSWSGVFRNNYQEVESNAGFSTASGNSTSDSTQILSTSYTALSGGHSEVLLSTSWV